MKFSFGKLAGIGLGAAGLATGNPALIMAGASILGTDIQSEAAKDAAKTQEQGVAKAKAESDAIYNQSRASFAPYMQMGTGAMGHLGQLVGLPPGGGMTAGGMPPSGPAAPTIPGQQGPQMPGSEPSSMWGMADRMRNAAQGGEQAQLRGAALNESGVEGTREGMDLGSLGGLVLLQAPNGELKRVPQRQAESFVSRGAQVVR